jgi:predicted nucleic acid-binding protein
MSESFVADSSVGVAWAVVAQGSSMTDDLLEQVTGGTSVVTPSLWPFEVANALLASLRRKKITRDERNRALAALAAIPLVVDDADPRLAFGRISELAAEHGLTVYDATYLELALRRNLPLASRDDTLCKAARDCGVRLLI